MRAGPGRAGRGRLLRAGAVLAALVAVGGGCGGGRPAVSPPDPTSTTGQVAPVIPVKIGFLGAMTGAGAAVSRAVENGERLAVSQFAGDHPRFDLVLDVRSTDGTPAGAAAAARRLVADGVLAVIGPQAAGGVQAALPVLSAAGIPAVTATATTTELGESGWTSFFRVVADDQQQAVADAQELVTSLHVASLAVVAGTAASDRSQAAWVSSEATGLGASVGLEASVTTAAGAEVTAAQIVASGVAGVFFSGSAPAARSLVADLSNDGYQGAILIASDAPSSVLRPLGSQADGVYVAGPVDDSTAAAASGGAALVFNDAYRAAFGAEPPLWSAEAYDATNILLAAVASGAPTGPAVIEYLFNHTSAGVTEVVSFDSNGDQSDPRSSSPRSGTGLPSRSPSPPCPPADASPVGGGECRVAHRVGGRPPIGPHARAPES